MLTLCLSCSVALYLVSSSSVSFCESHGQWPRVMSITVCFIWIFTVILCKAVRMCVIIFAICA